MRQVIICPGEDGYWVAESPSLPGCVSLRGLEKVELHCLLSVAVMQAMALGKAKEEAPRAVRNNVRLVA